MIEVKLQDLPVVHGLYCLLHDICEMKGRKRGSPAFKIATYEGEQFEIISLTGTLLPGNNGSKRMGSWTVTLGGGPKAKIWGGVVADKLIAASVVKVILGCFSVDGKKASLNNQNSQPPPVPPVEFAASGSTPTPTDSSGDNEEIPFDQGGPSGVFDDDDDDLLIPNLTMYQQMWDLLDLP
ncbi:hypothetical protein P8452_40984 [Trifolium repens]|nr:hypothetical protein P8452_40984 [Trifolium repens]